MDNESSHRMGEMSVARSMLHEVLSKLPTSELDILQDRLAGEIDDLRRLWGSSLSPFQSGLIKQLERIEVRIRHREKFMHSDQPAADKPYFLCRKCEASIIIRDFDTVSCPTCGTSRWLELVFA